MSKFWIIPLIAAVLVIGPFLIWGETLGALYDVDGTVELLRDQPGRGWLIGVGLIVADLFLPIPLTAVIAALGIIYGPVIGTIAALVGVLLAASLGYALGRLLGRPAARRLIGGAMARGERLFAAYGGWIVAGSRWMPVLPEVVSMVAGLSLMPYPRFILAAFAGALPLCAVFAVFGHLGADSPGLTLAVSAVAPFLLWFIADRSGVTRGLTRGGDM